jgi:hypothetical protein
MLRYQPVTTSFDGFKMASKLYVLREIWGHDWGER